MKMLEWNETVALLRRFKIPVAEHYSVSAANVAVQAKKLCYPVVVKALSPDIVHKTEGGFVKVVSCEDELLKAFEIMRAALKKKKIRAEIIVQRFVKGTEVIVGVKRDASFGNVITFGLGGVFVEVLKDVSFRMAPVNENEAEEMIREIKGYKILEGYRGGKVRVKKLAELIVNVSRLCERNSVSELDLNPVMVGSDFAVSVDARVIC